ncbi:MAG: hypothetical protein OZ921_17065 [Sorangiineae bacterium]|nr:hypothetical protein [Polyangiaceae bacterium]MEB2324227.1 hypothetical protein [Sorangiineae bacterium]
MSAFLGGATLGATRLRRASSLLATLVAFALVALDAALERRVAGRAATDHALVGAVFGVAIPLLAYLTSERVSGGARLDDSLDALARHGANRRGLALGALALSAALMATAGALLAAEATWLTGGSDARLSAGLGALAGALYAAWFGAASTFGRRGGGRAWALALDWLLGSGAAASALPWPRGHLRNLLGAEPVLELSQRSSSFIALCIALVCVGVMVRRTAP